jgi:hypothetical protein
MNLVRLVVEGGLASAYGMVWAMCIYGMGVIASIDVTLLASMFACFLSCMHICT